MITVSNRFSAGPPNAPDFKLHRGIDRILKTRLILNNMDIEYSCF